MKKKHPLLWYVKHAISAFIFQFHFNATQDFWWGDEDLMDEYSDVSFRFFKIWIANFTALLLYAPVILIGSGVVRLIEKKPIDDLMDLMGMKIILGTIVIFSCFLANVDMARFKAKLKK